MFLLMFLEIITYNYTRFPMIVDKFWKIGNLYQGKMVVDLAHSKNSNYLRLRLISFDQVNH